MKVSIVVALYVFIGNSGVLSFGHISFVALGAWTAGVLSVPTSEKPAIMPNLADFLVHRHTGNVTSLVFASIVGGIAAFVVGIPLMRLSGLAAGIATFAVLEITHNLLTYEETHRPGAERVLFRPGDDRAPAGGDRRGRLHRGRLRVRAQPLRTALARDA